MTYTWTYLPENSQECKRLLGISYENLIELIELAKKLNKKQKEKIEKKTTRLIRPGGGAKPKLSVENQIILTLIYQPSWANFSSFSFAFSSK